MIRITKILLFMTSVYDPVLMIFYNNFTQPCYRDQPWPMSEIWPALCIFVKKDLIQMQPHIYLPVVYGGFCTTAAEADCLASKS